jgi:hypothetical protein
MSARPEISSNLEAAIEDAVTQAISEGLTPRQFIDRADDAWREALDDKARSDRAQFTKALEAR